MPVNAKYLDDEERVVLIEMIGLVDSAELSDVIVERTVEYALANPSWHIHVVYDVRELTWDFAQFVKYIGILAERRKSRVMPTNLTQHFIGSNLWLSNFRSWMEKQYSEQFNGFTDTEKALDYIKGLETND